MVTITTFGTSATPPPAVQPEMAVYDQRMPAPMQDDCGCGGNGTAMIDAAYRRYMVIQVLAILFYLLLVILILKSLLK